MKKIFIAVSLSFVGPGLGQIYNKDYKKGIILMALSAVFFILPLGWIILKVAPQLPDPKTGPLSQEMIQPLILNAVGEGKHILNYISFTFIGIWAYSITQAYFRAKENQEKETPIDTE